MFSYTVLRTLLDEGAHIVGVFVGQAISNTPPVIPLHPNRFDADVPISIDLHPPSIVTLAWEANIPVWQVHRSESSVFAEYIAALQADVLCVACFDQHLPSAICALPRLAAVNVHPSLLPRHRGPAPIFWTFRSNERITGVSIHLLTPQLDAGPLIAQQAITILEGQRASFVERTCARVGGILLARLLRDPRRLEPCPQDETWATYEPWPCETDFHISPTWSVAHAYFFMRGVADWGMPFTIETPNGVYHARDALGYQHTPTSSSTTVLDETMLAISFPDGLLFVEDSSPMEKSPAST